MNERRREEIALFRYGVICDFIQGELHWGERKLLLEAKTSRQWRRPNGETCSISQAAIKQWLRKYKRDGIDGLKPKTRRDKGEPRVIDAQLKQQLIQLRQDNPNWGVPELARHLRQTGLVTEEQSISLSTLYRLVGKAARDQQPTTDHRRYGFEHPLECVQADVMYGPYVVGDDRKKHRTYLHAILDDATRLILAGEFQLSENVAAFEQVLKQALLRRGYVPERLYTDNGAAFISHHIQWVSAQLGMKLLHTRPHVPEGKGKIERFFRRVREQFLTRFWRDGLTLADLNEAFWRWVELDYHRSPHKGLDGRTPLDVWVSAADHLVRRPRVDPDTLPSLFRHHAFRVVSKDRVVRLNGWLLETPVEVAGERVDLLYDPADLSQVELRFRGKSFGVLRPLRTLANQKVRRSIKFVKED
jgi:transposase InsO family protein